MPYPLLGLWQVFLPKRLEAGAHLSSGPFHLLLPFSLYIPHTLLLSFACCSLPLC